MARSALQVVFSIDSLRRAWADVSARATGRRIHSSGYDGISISAFRESVIERLRRLSKSNPKTYIFGPLLAHIIQKPNSEKKRIICVPNLEDRIVQRSILNFLSLKYPDKFSSKSSYGFVRGNSKGVRRAVENVKTTRKAKEWVYKTDITSFFDRLDRRILLEQLEKVPARSLHNILIQAASCEISERSRSKMATIKQQGIRRRVGVRQGMPLSPFFANLFLQDFDRKAEHAGFTLFRYADDFIILCERKDECIRADEFCREELARIGLEVPALGEASKTVIYEPGQSAEFLGVEIQKYGNGYQLGLSKQQKLKLKQEIHTYSDIDFLDGQGIGITQFAARLDSKIAGYESAYHYCDDFVDTQSMLEATRRATVKHLVVDILGVNIDALGVKEKKFLEF